MNKVIIAIALIVGANYSFETHCLSKSPGQLDEGICVFYDYSEFFHGFESKTDSLRLFRNF